MRVIRGCQAFHREGLTSREVRLLLGGPGNFWGSLGNLWRTSGFVRGKGSHRARNPRKFKSNKKVLMPIIFLPAILGPEMAAPILWAPGIFLVLSAGKNPMPIKFFVLGGGSGVFRKGGWKCQLYFYGRGFFFPIKVAKEHQKSNSGGRPESNEKE